MIHKTHRAFDRGHGPDEHWLRAIAAHSRAQTLRKLGPTLAHLAEQLDHEPPAKPGQTDTRN